MTTTTLVAPPLAGVAGRSLARDACLVATGTVWVALLGQVAIPLGFTPVPLSLGTFAVLSVGLALGWARGLVSLALFVLVGWLGAPVFAGGASGFGLPTTGYVLGYVAAAGLVGYCAERGLDRSPLRLFGVVAAASAVIYLFGLPCLALMTGLSWSQAVVQGLLPFLLGDLLKAAAAAGLFPALWRLVGLIAPGARGEG